MKARLLLVLCAACFPAVARAQRSPPASQRINESIPSDSVIATWIGQYPDRARDSVRAWLARAASADSATGAGALVRANELGASYARVWGDSFPMRLAQRFTDWPLQKRMLWARADSLRVVGNAALGTDGPAVAIRDWRASIQTARDLGDSALVAAAIGNIGAAFYRAIELDSARLYFTEARRLAGLASDRRTLLNALSGLASVNKDQGHVQAAAAQYTEAIALRRQIGDYRGVAADDNNLGLVAAAVGDDAEARRRHVESLVIAREHGLDEAAAAALVNLGVLSSESGDAVTAAAQYDEALSLYRKLDDPADAALVLDNLGLLESAQGQYPLAVTHFKASLEILRRTGPMDLVVGVRRDLAIVFAAMGNLGEAGRQITAAERLALHGSLRPATNGRLELVRGDLALDFNRFPAARAAYTTGLTLLRHAQDQAGEADALTALGTLDLIEEDNASARDLLARAATRQDLLGNRRAAAIARLLGAKAARDAGDTAGARTMIAATLDSLRKDGDPVAEAWALCQRGDLERATGAALAAEATYRQGLDRLGRRPAPSAAMCLFGGLGETLRGRGALGDAESVFDHGVRSIERTANDLPVSGARADYLTDKWRLYADLGSTQHAAGNDSMAFQTSERMRARETLDMLVRGPVARPANSTSQADARATALRRRITALMDVGGPQDSIVASRGADALDRFPDVQREALARAQQAYANLLDSLDHDRPDDALRTASPTPGWREVAARLSADEEALVEFLGDRFHDDRICRHRRTPRCRHTAGMTGAELATEVDFVRGVLAASPATVRGKLWRAPLATLHSQLIAPIERAGLLRNKYRLLIVPHRDLHYLPFAASHGRRNWTPRSSDPAIHHRIRVVGRRLAGVDGLARDSGSSASARSRAPRRRSPRSECGSHRDRGHLWSRCDGATR